MHKARHLHENGGQSPASCDKKKEIRSWILCIALAVACALVLRLFVFEFVIVDGQSMENTLYSTETIFVEKVTKVTSGYTYGEILIVRYPNMKGAYVKRLVGMAGDTLAVKDGYLYRNGEKQKEDYMKDGIMYSDFEEITVPEGCVFVMGDNRNASLDSRDPRVGPIKLGEVIGHALFVIWPLTDIRGITY